jgi:phospho-N-acetylmuramoyl-pentapeptide-transferase
MTVSVLLPILIAFAISAISGPFVIHAMTKLKASNTERKEGVQAHLKKAGTPTMGGIMILAGILVTGIIYLGIGYTKIGPVLVLTVGFGLIGFLDDFLKVAKHNSDGLLPWQKLLLQFAVTFLFWYLLRRQGISLALRLPFGGGRVWDIGFFAIPLLFLAVLATVNGVNFTDGVDGLAGTVTIAVAGFFLISSVLLKAGVEPIAGAVIGALMGFLIYNAYPAKIFMGDTGSLALGGFVAGIAYMQQMPLFILIVGFIYALELISVVMQVTYFKATHGKRIFKMTPIHHHFELSGWSETRIVAVFGIITALLGVLALIHL